MTEQMTKEQRQLNGLIDLDEWVMVTPFGPMRHRETGETYQGRGVRMEHESQKRIAAHANRLEK